MSTAVTVTRKAIIRFDKGDCVMILRKVNEVECIYECTDIQWTTQVDCESNGETWDVPTGYTWLA